MKTGGVTLRFFCGILFASVCQKFVMNLYFEINLPKFLMVLIITMLVSIAGFSQPTMLEYQKAYKLSLVREAPIFPGCENEDEFKIRKCLASSIIEYFEQNFDFRMLNDLFVSVDQVKKWMLIQLVIDDSGKTSFIRCAPVSYDVEVETKRILKDLPAMIPGRKKGQDVLVKLSLSMDMTGGQVRMKVD